MALNDNDLRNRLLGDRMKGDKGQPAIAEIKVDADVKDFDEAVDELYQRAEALINIAPHDKVEQLQSVCDALKSIKSVHEELPEVSMESEGGKEMPPEESGSYE